MQPLAENRIGYVYSHKCNQEVTKANMKIFS